jgi:hypothetical protein
MKIFEWINEFDIEEQFDRVPISMKNVLNFIDE